MRNRKSTPGVVILPIRLRDDADARIRAAAELEETNRSAFMRDAALEKAEQILRDAATPPAAPVKRAA